MKNSTFISRLSLGAILTLSLANESAAHIAICEPIEHHQIKELVHHWNMALQSGDATIAANEYADSAILLATYRGEPLLSRQQRIDYFSEFLKKGPSMYIDSEWSDIGCNSVVHSGLYTFHMQNGDVAKARYTFTFRFEGDRWRISSHHSSVMPQ